MTAQAATTHTIVRPLSPAARSVRVSLGGGAVVLDLTGVREARAAAITARTSRPAARAA